MPHFPKPFFKKSRGVWYVQIAGRQHNLGPDQDAAFTRYYDLMRCQPVAAVRPTAFSEVVDLFLEWVTHNRSPDTFEWYQYRLERFCKRYPSLTTAELRPFHVQQWIDSYPHLGKTSRRNYARTVKRCCRWAVQQGYLEHNPIQGLEVPIADRRDTCISEEYFKELLALVRDDAFRDLILTTWETGCRPQESLRVEARHVDLARQRWVFPASEAKGKRQPRIIYLNDAALEITKRRLALCSSDPLFRNTDGIPWTPDAVNCAFTQLRTRWMLRHSRPTKEALEEAIKKELPKLKKQFRSGNEKSKSYLRTEARQRVVARMARELAPACSLYSLRHAWATKALQSGLDGLTVAILMGHSDPSTLARVYQHLSHNPQHLLQQVKRATQN